MEKNDVVFSVYDLAEDLDDPETISHFLKAAMESNDEQYIAKAIGVVIRAQNMSDVARRVGISRQYLYKIASGQTHPSFKTVLGILNAVGVSLQPVARKV